MINCCCVCSGYEEVVNVHQRRRYLHHLASSRAHVAFAALGNQPPQDACAAADFAFGQSDWVRIGFCEDPAPVRLILQHLQRSCYKPDSYLKRNANVQNHSQKGLASKLDHNYGEFQSSSGDGCEQKRCYETGLSVCISIWNKRHWYLYLDSHVNNTRDNWTLHSYTDI